jgi:hypothetical protein
MNEKKAPSEKTLRNRLQAIIDQEPCSIRAEVAREALDYENITDFFQYLQRCGCQSGFIGPLIYYRDTHAFYDRHYDEIEELRCELEDSLGQPLQIKGDLKNWFAWFGFEETAYRMVEEIGLEGL